MSMRQSTHEPDAQLFGRFPDIPERPGGGHRAPADHSLPMAFANPCRRMR
ncbi:hypothetical protein EBBID32_33880 [Sphingobium indicum BiD32]|uniref:Uncharacterized protein n=1 Tax=Sphingobium indicum BiD32 TaxID=1301087 RepID=N1MQK2_9SPHN|nr:hypothetical protein EBBID32_33880 [Sphingobium indicum BiD32]